MYTCVCLYMLMYQPVQWQGPGVTASNTPVMGLARHPSHFLDTEYGK